MSIRDFPVLGGNIANVEESHCKIWLRWVWDNMKSQNFVDYYEVLQVSPKASREVIEAAYRRLALKYHPDVGGNEEDFKLLNEAYQVLTDERQRAAYDELYNDLLSETQDHYNDAYPGAKPIPYSITYLGTVALLALIIFIIAKILSGPSVFEEIGTLFDTLNNSQTDAAVYAFTETVKIYNNTNKVLTKMENDAAKLETSRGFESALLKTELESDIKALGQTLYSQKLLESCTTAIADRRMLKQNLLSVQLKREESKRIRKVMLANVDTEISALQAILKWQQDSKKLAEITHNFSITETPYKLNEFIARSDAIGKDFEAIKENVRKAEEMWNQCYSVCKETADQEGFTCKLDPKTRRIYIDK